jgi:hypothetical protein
MPTGAGNTHQDWFYVRLERRQTPQGLRFRYLVNGKTFFDYTDPDPLADSKSGGRIAFWTYNGGLSIARARIWYDGLNSAGETAAQSTLAALPSQPLLENGAASIKNALGEWKPRRDDLLHQSSLIANEQSAGRRAIRISNPLSGGDWTTFITRQPFDAAQQPNLRFDYRLPSGVRLNLYALVDGRWREIVFSGNSALPPSRRRRANRPATPPTRRIPPANGPAIVPGLAPVADSGPLDLQMQPGRIANVVADGAWHTASFDLLSALRAAGLPTRVEALAFAAPDRDYLRCGLGGNHLGATFWIAGFQAGAATKPTGPSIAALNRAAPR